MAIDRSGVMRPIFGLKIKNFENCIEVTPVRGSTHKVLVSLAIEEWSQLCKAAVSRPEGAILNLHMETAAAEELCRQIQAILD